MLKLTIGHTIVAIAAFTCLVSLCLAAASNRFLGAILDAIGVASTATQGVRNHGEADMMHDALRGDVLALLLLRDPASLSEGRAELDRHAAGLRAAVETNRKLPLGAEVRSLLDGVLPSLENYVRSAQTLDDLAVANPRAARARLTEFETAYGDLEGRMAAVSDRLETDGRSAQSAGFAAIGNMRWQMGLMILVATLITCLVLLLLAQNILRPLERLIRNLRTFAAGGAVRDRMDESYAGELGQVARLFNQYLHRLETDLVQREARDADVRGQLQAIQNGLAMMEFDLQGNIRCANAHMLDAFGYLDDELVDRHHRVLVAAEEHDSADYVDLWRGLQQGRHRVGEFKRLGKGGRAVWLQAIYNPILDPDGKPYKVVMLAIDITARKVDEINKTRQLEELNRTQIALEMAPDQTILGGNDNLTRALGYPIEELRGRKHDLLVDAETRASREYSQLWSELRAGRYVTGEFKRIGKGGKEVWLQTSFNPLIDSSGQITRISAFATDITARKRAQSSLSATLMAVSQNAESLASASEELTRISQSMMGSSQETASQASNVAGASEQVHRNVASVAAGAEETGITVREVARSAADAALVATEAVSVAAQVNRTVAQLGQSSQEIDQVIKVITSIAEQTNLLALNATIEAARAGGAGKGFAVVANEVKELAKETARATEDISRKIEAIQSDTGAAVVAIQNVTAVIQKIHDYQNTIASAVEEQSATVSEIGMQIDEAARGSERITVYLEGVVQGAQTTASGANQTQQAAQELARMANDLRALLEENRNAA